MMEKDRILSSWLGHLGDLPAEGMWFFPGLLMGKSIPMVIEIFPSLRGHLMEGKTLCSLFQRGKLSNSSSRIFYSFNIFSIFPISGGFLFGVEIFMSILDMLTFLRIFHHKKIREIIMFYSSLYPVTRKV